MMSISIKSKITVLIHKVVNLNRNYSNKLLAKFPKFFSGESYTNDLNSEIKAIIDSNNPKNVLEVGGIDRPLLTKNNTYKYDGCDIEEKETCYDIYDQFFVQSIEDPLNEKYDLIISITLLEHVAKNDLAIKNIYELLNENGCTCHYIPSKYHPYSLILRLVGPKLQKILIKLLRSHAADVTGYPAFFDYCSISQMKNLFKKTGFVQIEIKPYYKENDYFSFFVPLYIIIGAFSFFCEKFNWSYFASGFIIKAKRL